MSYDAGADEAAALLPRFSPVPIPHDWLIGDSRDLYREGSGWYVKTFRTDSVPGAKALLDEGGHVLLTFEGIYMDSTVYVNRQKAGECPCGYTTFTLDITPYLTGGDNEILVCARHRAPNSRWYSGAGINRDVWIRFTGRSYIPENGIYVVTKAEGKTARAAAESPAGVPAGAAAGSPAGNAASGRLHVEAQCVCPDGCTVMAALYDDAGRLIAEKEAGAAAVFAADIDCPDVHLWSPEEPRLYTLEVRLFWEGVLLEKERIRTGFKQIRISPDEGLFVNGRHYKLQGVCLHHDQGALGSAFHRQALERQFRTLKEMGVNALRCAHSLPAPAFMELADEMGFLVMSEAFDMWERPKTPWDYARFFPKWHAFDVEQWVKRDRNHVSLLFWSIGNEIYDTHADPERGTYLVKHLADLVRRFDPLSDTAITLGSNWLPWENTRKCVDSLKLVGYNYGEKYYAAHHKEHPDWAIFGSETSSIVQSRGIYHFPLSEKKLSEDDGQCSSLGNSPTSWGAQSLEDCVAIDRDIPWSLGQFIWSGADYFGEPTPYHSRNSFFGLIDTAGFPKDAYYVWQSAWRDPAEYPMIHIFPYWDHNPGQMIDIRVASNAVEAELFLNGKSLGRQRLTHKAGSGKHLIADYRAAFEPGELLAKGYDGDGNCIASERIRSFKDPAGIVLKADEGSRAAGSQAAGAKLFFVTISAVDEDGAPVENACSRVSVEVSGAGHLVGLDNGDSTDYESVKGTSKRLFSGKLLAIIAADDAGGRICVRVTSPGLEGAELILDAAQEQDAIPVRDAAWDQDTIPVQENRSGAVPHAFPGERRYWFEDNRKTQENSARENEIPVRCVKILEEGGRVFSPEKRELSAQAAVLPEGADDREVVFSVVDDKGVPSRLVTLTQSGNRAVMSAKGDGTFRLRCTSKSGTDAVRIISELEYTVTGIGKAYADPYDFVYGSLYSECVGDVTPGNERGVATMRDGTSIVTYRDLDFGQTGSDTVTIPIFTLTDEEYPLEIWEGVPETEGAELLASAVYCKKSIYNVYQEETFRLKRRLKGVTAISFRVHQKMHIKGFSFERIERCAQRLTAGEADRIYGDSFERQGTDLISIGNNVTLEYDDMHPDRLEAGKGYVYLTVEGRTRLEICTIQLRLTGDGRQESTALSFKKSEEWTRQSFKVSVFDGIGSAALLFLPGSDFDLRAVTFSAEEA